MRSRPFSYVACALFAVASMPRAAFAQNEQVATVEQEARIPSAQLDSLVAPIALYPDPLLAQVLAASTYPLELVQLQQWLAQHQELKDQALVDAVSQQNWDPSVQSMAALPDVVKALTSDVKWTTDLGNAFLAQESDVMDAVQRMRAKANGSGKLKSDEHIKVESGANNVIVIEQADPQVVYVPSYNPTVVYGEPSYPYPAIAYPPVGYYAAGAALSFGVGIAMGAAFHGGWGYGCGWGGHGNNNININRQNNFQRNSARVSGGQAGGGRWQHNPQHRGGTPYGNRATSNRFGDTRNARSSSAGARSNGAGFDRGGADRGGGAGNRGGADRGGAGNRGGGDRVGNRSVQSGNRSGGGSSALGSGSRSGGSGQAARQSSSRGSASRGSASSAGRSRSSGGGARSGGSRGGGGRGGGGRGGGRR